MSVHQFSRWFLLLLAVAITCNGCFVLRGTGKAIKATGKTIQRAVP